MFRLRRLPEDDTIFTGIMNKVSLQRTWRAHWRVLSFTTAVPVGAGAVFAFYYNSFLCEEKLMYYLYALFNFNITFPPTIPSYTNHLSVLFCWLAGATPTRAL